MTIEPEPDQDDRLELTGEEVGQVEGPELLVLHRGVGGRTRVELVAVRAGDPFHALVLEHLVERPTGAAVRVGHEDTHIRAEFVAGLDDPLSTASAIRLGRMWRRASTQWTLTPGRPFVRTSSSRASAPATDDDDTRRGRRRAHLVRGGAAATGTMGASFMPRPTIRPGARPAYRRAPCART